MAVQVQQLILASIPITLTLNNQSSVVQLREVTPDTFMIVVDGRDYGTVLLSDYALALQQIQTQLAARGG